MTAKHTGAVFNHSCLKVPVNPTNKLPLPTFERKRVPHYLDNDHVNKAISSEGTGTNYEFLRCAERPSSSDSRECRSKTSTPQDHTNSALKIMGECTNKESIKSFIDFYESIPDYGDLNHLSDREFYVRLQHIKAKQRTYLRDLDDKDFGALEVVEENKVNAKRSVEKKPPTTSDTWLKHYNDNLNLRGKKCDLDDKSPLPASYSYQTRLKKYLDSCDSSLYCDKLNSKNYISPSPTVSAVSLDDTTKFNSRNNPKPTIQLNNYVLHSEEPEGVSRIGLSSNKSLGKESKLTSPLFQHELYKIKAKKLNNGTNKIRDTHSASTNKAGTLTGDSSSSIIDSMWDGFSIEDYVPKAELFSDSDSGQDDVLELPLSCSVPNSTALKQSKNVAWREPKITVPKPFTMTLREEEDRHINLLQYRLYGDDNLDGSKEESKIIRAHPVPLESQLPLFDKIVAEQENRRRQVRRQCMNELRAQMKPFKFMKRDEERKWFRMCRSTPDLRDFGDTSPKPKPFKAKPVPKNLFSSYIYQRMREDEYYRALKKKIRAEELLKSSSLPPSMAARERLSKARALSTEMLNSDSERPKRRKHKIPNYKKSHEQMKKELEDRWNDNITTSTQPFTLRTAELHKRKSAKFLPPDDSSTTSPYEVYPRERVRPRSALGIPLNRNNLASVLRIQSSRQRMERELAMKQEEVRKKEETRLKAHVTRRKPAWQALNYSTEEDLAMRIQTRREEERIHREEYEQDMQLMWNRVDRIPTLFERQSQAIEEETHKSLRKTRSKSGHSMKISSIPTTPDLYEEDEGEEEEDINESEILDDKNMKMGLKVSISETPETIQCPSEVDKTEVRGNGEEDNFGKKGHEDWHEEDEKKDVQETKENKDVEEKEEDECENTGSIEEDITAGKSSDEDDEGGNTYNID